jgi:hypothetical protein
MNRILDFSISDEEAIVSRILVQLHKAVDEHFPSASAATRQFTKTVFSPDDEESTAMLKAPPSEFAEEVNTADIDVGEDGAENSTPDSKSPVLAGAAAEPADYHSQLNPLKAPGDSAQGSQISEFQKKEGRDIVTLVVAAFLLAGLAMLIWLLMF